MFHRVQIETYEIPRIYKQRNMLVETNELMSLIEKILDNGFKIGSIQDTLNEPSFFHLTFDDGFKEHLEIAHLIKKEYNFKPDSMTFSINAGNSLDKCFTGMDVIYQMVQNHDKEKVIDIFQLNKDDSDTNLISEIKERIIGMNPDELITLGEEFEFDKSALEGTFLNANEVKELSQLFNIASHGQSHRDLTNHLHISSREMKESKTALERLINKRVITFCYPEGKNNKALQDSCRRAGYKYGLSINHEDDNPCSIGRFCVNNHRKELMERING